jgi:EamA domain-containing membrane protein RarD
MPPARLIGFILVWIALAVLGIDGFRHAQLSKNEQYR